MADKYREVENTLSVFYNKKITRKKSIRKEANIELKIRYRKVKLT
jgi:hypothetical protein